MVFQYISIRQVPWEVLKTVASGLGFQHLPWDLANVNARKTMFDPYTEAYGKEKETLPITATLFGSTSKVSACLRKNFVTFRQSSKAAGNRCSGDNR